MDDFPKLIFIVAISQLLIEIFELVDGEFALPLIVQKSEVTSSSFFSEWVSLKLSKKYDFIGQLLEELLEVQSMASSCFEDLLKSSIH